MGLTANQFDNAVKNKGPTLIIIKNTIGYVFGAYIDDVWGNGNGWIRGSLKTFLFTFGSDGNHPLKLLHNGGQQGIHISSCGVHLSSDLVTFCSNSCSPSTYTKISDGYENVQITTNTLAGSQNWTPSYIEVFHIIKK